MQFLMSGFLSSVFIRFKDCLEGECCIKETACAAQCRTSGQVDGQRRDLSSLTGSATVPALKLFKVLPIFPIKL